MADLGDGVELSVIKVDGAAGGSENGSSGVMGSPVRMRDRPEADLVAGDASALTPTHTNPDARQGAGKHKPKVTAGIPSAVFNFLNSIVGAGIIGLPFALKEAGVFSGLALLVVMAYATYYTVCLLIDMGRRTKTDSYEDLCQAVFGKFGFMSVTLAMWFFAYGALLAYLIIIGDTVTQVLSHWDGEPVTQTTRRLVIVGVAIVFVLPLALVKNMAKLAKTSALSITAVVWIVGVVFVRSFTGVTDDVPVPTTDAETELKVFNDNFFPAIGAISFAFTCHHSTFIVFNSLENNTDSRWRRTSASSLSLALGLCLLLAVPGYFMFRDLTQGNLLNNFGSDDQIANVTRLAFSLTMILTYPMEIFVARHTMHALMYDGPITTKRHYIISLCLWASSVLIALVVEDLGFVLELTGGVSGTYIGFMLPGMLYLRLADYRLAFWKNEGRVWETFRDMAPAVAVTAFGFVALVNGTTITIKNAIENGI